MTDTTVIPAERKTALDIEQYKKLTSEATTLFLRMQKIEGEIFDTFASPARQFYNQLKKEWGYGNHWDGVKFTSTSFVISTWYGGESGDDEEFPIELLFLNEEHRNAWIVNYIKEQNEAAAERVRQQHREYMANQEAARRATYEKLKQEFEGATK